jgi:drug/metabolite transporter (DMT)-like permease
LPVVFVAFLEHTINSVASLPGLIKQRASFKGLKLSQWAGLLYIGAGSSALGALFYVQGAVAMNYNFTVAALLQKFQPIFAIILAVIFLKEKVNYKLILLAVPALLGGYLVTFGLISPSGIFSSSNVPLMGPVLALLAALLWAGGTVVGRSLVSKLDLQFVNGMRFIFGFLFLAVFGIFTNVMKFSMMTPLFWRNVVIIALLTGFFALLLYYYGLKSTKASVATLMELGYPLAMTVVNWKFLGIMLSSWQIVGGVILLGSVTSIVLFSIKNNEESLDQIKDKENMHSYSKLGVGIWYVAALGLLVLLTIFPYIGSGVLNSSDGQSIRTVVNWFLGFLFLFLPIGIVGFIYSLIKVLGKAASDSVVKRYYTKSLLWYFFGSILIYYLVTMCYVLYNVKM